MSPDPFNLERFVEAQRSTFDRALGELRSGYKAGHWMWFVFPQHRDLGRSEISRFYGLSGVGEARAYLAHPVLGPRLRQAAQAILPHLAAGIPAEAILGPVDALKLCSSMAIFAEAEPEEPLFRQVLAATGAAC